ncbi:MAG: CDP-diacylglycerol--glycerol-3-phosphate 3-phosphatidyltransferase [Candidatus Marinimicrobia bacterium]|jgi:CDP-diacylglycerol--glycerol-3-phosphate 3-phosphatidyltransferase|nr:CDP-diacylglycerol--glycerol-3-phosphate 3-phosphatidyltransferase [Candidatus Neomarinimicrobiota bacterium]MDP6499288.1 CDP-diacylglycerol--glycerol-3-phosphate 3-phosphatidyltransferase [Candidatus Neomarinimicrobiota bacterium]MDP6726284.1 CDP-diacylglycerol--glycerol-3-phosphate 3-phosphatidyltransferase [Candidatus Neomarinimicrobiota bacterium]|tara:strand:+ start:2869 stop:3456 length:588 start_codon:yes stop_codon:yes gene_type:complete
MKLNIPNSLSLLRIGLTPVFIIFLFYDHPYANLWALIIFLVASITDALDGYYARKHDQITDQGRFLDPLADKILVLSALISFAVLEVIPYWMVALIVFRDLFITGLRVVMNNKGFQLVTSNIAKAKTSFQLAIIVTILFYLGFSKVQFDALSDLIQFIRDYDLIYFLTLIVTVFTAYTGFSYIYENRSVIRQFLS